MRVRAGFLQVGDIQPAAELEAHAAQAACVGETQGAMKGEAGKLVGGNHGDHLAMAQPAGALEEVHQQRPANAAAVMVGMHVQRIFHREAIGAASMEAAQGSPTHDRPGVADGCHRHGMLLIMLRKPRRPLGARRRLLLIGTGGMQDIMVVNVVDRFQIGGGGGANFQQLGRHGRLAKAGDPNAAYDTGMHTHSSHETADSPQHPTRRFSVRVADYVKYRPGYPPELLEDLREQQLLTPGTRIADMGSGTGLLARVFLEAGHAVVGIEPNADMRAAGDEFLATFPRFQSRDATAEATGLPDVSVDLIIAGQAFHWFDRGRARAEFARILATGGGVALIWNERLTHSPFLRAYEALVHTYATDYGKIDHRQITEELLRAFFSPHAMRITSHPNAQHFDFDGLRGRLLSSSYAPLPGDPRHEPMLKELRRIFDEHQRNGCVSFDYLTKIHTARMK